MPGIAVDVAWVGADVDEQDVLETSVVVIDVLRATTMIAALFHGGARRVFPVVDVDEARRLAEALGRTSQGLGRENDVLLAGERGGLPPDGFDLGNSPTEAADIPVADRSVVLTTTNGTAAIHRALKADVVMTGAFVNAGAVVDEIVSKRPASLLVICAGTSGRFSLDDTLCAGLIVDLLREKGVAGALTDSAKAARNLYAYDKNDLYEAVSESRHGRRLHKLGLKDDVSVAVHIDRFDVLPVLTSEDGRHVLVLKS